MRDLTYLVAVSLDGYIADADGGWDAFSFEGDLAEHLISRYPDTLPGHVHEALGIAPTGSRYDTAVMGWNTYAPALSYGLTSPYPHLRQVVATRRHTAEAATLDAPGVQFTEDPRTAVRGLKAEPGTGIWLVGGGSLASTLIEEIDHLVLKLNPVVLGAGIPLFAPIARPAPRYEFVESRRFGCGVQLLELTRARP